MHYLKLAGALLGALFGLALTAVSASALTLPDVSIVLGGSYPLHLQGEVTTVRTTLGSASGVTFEGKGASLLLLAKELSALGTFSFVFKEVGIPGGAKCKTGTEPAGTVVLTGEYHVVPLNLTGTLAILFLISFLELACETAKIKIRGKVLATILKAGEEATQLTELGLDVEGVNGRQNVTSYYNDGGTLVDTNLESDAGLEFVNADENIAGEIVLTVLGSQMIQITGRL
jgi:hypothetical protein